MGMGLSMIGPTLLEFGTEEQKQRHLPKITAGQIQWCQGYSEPNAGSDLARCKTRADDHGDHFVINGQKIWTSGASTADWMFALVRTDFNAPKHDGISFVLLTMDQPGVTVKPIRLISGSSPFCETFFDNAIAKKEDLVGQLNKGWTVGKRLLQHERSGPGDNAAPAGREKARLNVYAQIAKDYIGERDAKGGGPVGSRPHHPPGDPGKVPGTHRPPGGGRESRSTGRHWRGDVHLQVCRLNVVQGGLRTQVDVARHQGSGLGRQCVFRRRARIHPGLAA